MATYYVSGATGNDGNDGLSEGNAKATIQGAVDQVATDTAGASEIFIKGDAVYSEGVLLSNSTHHPVLRFEGYDSTPGDGGMAEIDATGETSGFRWSGTNTVITRHQFVNLEVHSSTGAGIQGSDFSSTTGRWIVCVNCHVHDCGGSGVFSVNGRVAAINCRLEDNTALGIFANGSGTVVAIGTLFRGNGTHGVAANGGLTAIHCTSIGNGTSGFRQLGATNSPFMTVVNCTVDGESTTTDGISRGTTDLSFISVVNNIIVGCTTGIDAPVAANTIDRGGLASRNNTLHDNGTASNNMVGMEATLTNDPLFVDPNNDDYRLQLASPSKGMGYDLNNTLGIGSIADRGAQQVLAAGGAGGAGSIRTGGQL